MKLLSLEDTLAAAQDAGVPDVELLVAQAEAVAENIAMALADHLGIKCRNTNFWDGKLYTTFLAAHPGQACPPMIECGDLDGEWQADGDNITEEGPSMSMSG